MEICVAFQAHRKDAVFQQGVDRADVFCGILIPSALQKIASLSLHFRIASNRKKGFCVAELS